MKTYIIVVTDDEQLRKQPSILTDNTRIDFIGICTQTLSRHFGGMRYNVIINHTNIADLGKADDERVVAWYHRELVNNADRNVKIINGGFAE